MKILQQGLLALLLVFAATPGAATPPNVIVAAQYIEPTRRYPHGVLGDDVEWGALKITVDMCHGCETRHIRDFIIRLPEHRVFEDTEPRVVDLDGDGSPSVIVVESDANQGARLAVYTEAGFLTGTPFIGRRNRWLAPIGAADLDGDGAVEIAYVDRPHLAKTLRIWRYYNKKLTEVAQRSGLTNHRIGETEISGGLRFCNDRPEMIVANAEWSRLVSATYENGGLVVKDIGHHRGPESFAKAMRCP